MIIDGKAISEKIYAELRALSVPSQVLAAVLVGSASDAVSFVAQKEKAAKALGVRFDRIALEGNASEDDLLLLLKRLSEDNAIGGIILQLPLLEHIDTKNILLAIGCRKDVDVLNTEKKCLNILPPTVRALERILQELHFELSGKSVVVIGKGRLVGQPIGIYLRDRVGQLEFFDKEHFRTEILKEADLIVTGVGVPRLVTSGMVKPDAVVVDFGFAVENGRPCGDLMPPEEPSEIRYTPTPGGTGPVVVAELFWNFFHMKA